MTKRKPVKLMGPKVSSFEVARNKGISVEKQEEIDRQVKKVLDRSQPPPKKNNLPKAWDLTVADMIQRNEVGKDKYNCYLQPFNGRDTLLDAYEEILDLAVYLRSLLFERDGH